MANTNPGGINLNTSPYFDDYNEEKKFVRILYVPGRAVQARELTQMQTLQQVQTRRFANYFFKQGAIVDGCEQTLDLNLPYVKLQNNYNGAEANVASFENKSVFGANTGLKAYCGIVSDIEGADPKTLFINYVQNGSIVLTVNNAPTTLAPGNTITLSTGNTATIEAGYIDPISGVNKILVSNASGVLTATTANTVISTGAELVVNITAVSDKRANTEFDDNETLFTENTTGRAYAQSAASRATSTIVDAGLATETVFNRGSKVTVSEGILYLSDYFVDHSSQTLILDKYTNTPSYTVGIVTNKTFIDYIEDSTLVDNAQGTPNFQAPGADRFKINTVLTKNALGETTAETEFVTLLEVKNGITQKRKNITIENKLEDAIAQRTFEESGDYSLEDPKVIIREHLSQNSNGGRYVSGDGGNSNLLLVEVDPFTSYVSGYRNQFITKSLVDLTKGLDTEYVEQTKTQINYGQYVEVKELVGAWDFMEGTEIELYDTAQQAITLNAYSTLTVSGTQVGTARVRAIEYVSGTQGTADARYYLYIYDINVTSGTFADVRAFYDNATPKRYADIVLNSLGNAVVNESSFNSLIFRLPYDAIQTIRDDQQNIESGFRFKKKFSVTFNSGIATISTTDSSETFVGQDTLSNAQKNEFYQVIINNAGANVETAALSGTVTVSAASVDVVGTSTSFTSEVNIGDILKINGEQVKVASVANNSALTLTGYHSLGATANTYTKILATGVPIALDKVGGTGASRTVTVSSPGTIVVDIKENASFTGEVITTMDRANAREKRKTLVFQATVNVDPSTHPNGTAGPYGLGYGDIYQLHAVYQSPDFSTPANTSSTNVTSNYTLDNGQRDFAYEHGTITPTNAPTGRLLAVFDHFSHDTTQGVGYCSVDSYPVNDNTTSNTTITTANIPIFISPTTKARFDLRDSVDFRPVKTANTALNPIDVGTYQVPTGGLHIPKPSSDFDADLIFYKGRIAKIYVNSRGQFGVNNGVPAVQRPAKSPPKLPDTLELAEIIVPPYPSLPTNVVIRPLKNRRFTMKEIAKLSRRIEKLEYFNTLGFLEKIAQEKKELDAQGLERFKNGILVDPFVGTAIANVSDTFYAAAISRPERYLTCKQFNQNVTSVLFNSTSSSATITNGNKIMISFSSSAIEELTQSQASRQLRLAEELNFIWIGDMDVFPYGDNFVETEPSTVLDANGVERPANVITFDEENQANHWRALIDAWNAEVAPLNTQFIGLPSEELLNSSTGSAGNINVGGRNGGQVQVTTTLTQQTQATQFREATFTENAQENQTANRVVDVSVVHIMRSRDYIIRATGMKQDARVYAFFDGQDVTENCKQIKLTGTKTLQQIERDNFTGGENDTFLEGEGTDYTVIADGASSQAFRVGDGGIPYETLILFRLPSSTEKRFNVGQREFKLTDSPTNSAGTELTSARQLIFATGLKQEISQTIINSRPFEISFQDRVVSGERKPVPGSLRVTTSVQAVPPPPPPPPRPDPVAQSFFVSNSDIYLAGVDLYFRTKSTDDARYVTVEVREMINGIPGPRAVGLKENAKVFNPQINLSEDATTATRFDFQSPVYLQAENEYCLVIRPSANDPDYAIWVAELGQLDISSTTQARIESAWNTGVLFTSSNDRTWTPRQNLDIKFTAYKATFSTSGEALFDNVGKNETFSYDTITPFIGDIDPSVTNIKYEIKTVDSSGTQDESFTEIKNLERYILPSRRQISNTTLETAGGYKSLQLKATLTTNEANVTPYIDEENIIFNFSRNIINNSLSTSIDGTVIYSSGNTDVVGVGTDFANDVFVGEYADFGAEYRRIQSVTNTTHLTVSNAFTTSNAASQAVTIRNEEHPTGPYSSDSRYITKVVTLNDGFEAGDLSIYLNINRPAGTGIRVYCKLLNENDTDPFDDKFYTLMSLEGTERFTENITEYFEERYFIPNAQKTGGSQLLSGTVTVGNTTNIVLGSSTRFIEQLRIGDTLAVGTSRIERTVSTIANNDFLTVDTAFTANTSGQDVFKILNDEVAYTTPDGRTFSGFKSFAIKIAFISSNPFYAPRVKDLRVIALA